MSIQELKKIVQDKIAKSGIDGCISYLVKQIEKREIKQLELVDSIVIKVNEFNQLKKERILGLLDNQDITRKESRLVYSLLNLFDFDYSSFQISEHSKSELLSSINVNHNISKNNSEIQLLRDLLDKQNIEIAKLSVILSDAYNEILNTNQDRKIIENRIHTLEAELEKKHIELIRVKEKLIHLKSLNKSLKRIKKQLSHLEDENHKLTVENNNLAKRINLTKGLIGRKKKSIYEENKDEFGCLFQVLAIISLLAFIIMGMAKLFQILF